MKNRIEGILSPATARAKRKGTSDQPFSTDALKDQFEKARTTVEQAIVARPGTGLVIAASTGFLLGWLLKRK